MKVDFKKSLVSYRARHLEFRLLEVPSLEVLWWASDMDVFTPDMFDDAVAKVASKNRPTSLDKVCLERLDEGRCVQTLHIGSYDDEAEALAELHDSFIPNVGLRMTGKHHEIYLNDARKVEATKLRTILRQPVDVG